MPQSLSKVFLHVVFSTKDRLPLLDTPLQPELHAYLATLVRDFDAEAYRVGAPMTMCISPSRYLAP